MEKSIVASEAARVDHIFLKTKDKHEFKCPPALAYHSGYIQREMEKQQGMKENPIEVPVNLKILQSIKDLSEEEVSIWKTFRFLK